MRLRIYDYKCNIFSEAVRKVPANIPQMDIVVDTKASPCSHSIEKEIRTQVETLIKLSVIIVSMATEYSQVHIVPKLTLVQWRCTLRLESWPIPKYTCNDTEREREKKTKSVSIWHNGFDIWLSPGALVKI